MADIDVGLTGGSGYPCRAGYTYVEITNQSNGTGIIDTVTVLSRSSPYGQTIVIGTLYGTFPSLTGRDTVTIGQGGGTVTGLSLDIEENDYIGHYFNSGYGNIHKLGVNASYALVAGNAFGGTSTYETSQEWLKRVLTLYGSGETVAVGAIPQMLVSM